MFYKLTFNFGKASCVVLYAVFALLLVKEIWLPFALLFALHLIEYFIVGFRTAKEHKINFISGLINCLCFGFTWWLPVRKGDNKN